VGASPKDEKERYRIVIVNGNLVKEHVQKPKELL